MKSIFSLLLASYFLVACQKSPEIHIITGQAQGTTYTVKYWHENKITVSADTLKQRIDAEFARIDKLMSNYRDDSFIAMFNQQKIADEPLPLNQEIIDLLQISADVHDKSKGCYDPTIGPLFSIWGFKKDNLNIPTAEQIASQLEAVGFAKKIRFTDKGLIKAHPETTVGLSAIGQGYSVAQISQLLEAYQIENYLTEIGGEMLVAGKKPNNQSWQVGVERPVPNSQVINEIITLTGKQKTAIMTSGTYRHYFDDNGTRYSHILDPRTGKPVAHDSVAVTVLLPDASYADAWSTALLCLGSEAGLAVANQYAIPAIYYDLSGEQLVRKTSSSVDSQTDFWQSKPASN